MPKKVLNHFKKYDPTLYKAIVSFEGSFRDGPESQDDLFASLCRTIAGQQLSGKSADAIWSKFVVLFPRHTPTAKKILAMTEDELRASGFSYAKIRSLHDLSRRILDTSLNLEKLRQSDEAYAREQLQLVTGIGPWSAEMFLMFALGNEDVFSPGDLGLKKSIQKIYGLETLPTPEEATDIATCWSPYRTYASCALWTILDNR